MVTVQGQWRTGPRHVYRWLKQVKPLEGMEGLVWGEYTPVSVDERIHRAEVAWGGLVDYA